MKEIIYSLGVKIPRPKNLFLPFISFPLKNSERLKYCNHNMVKNIAFMHVSNACKINEVTN